MSATPFVERFYGVKSAAGDEENKANLSLKHSQSLSAPGPVPGIERKKA
jgi:hypothetical protein